MQFLQWNASSNGSQPDPVKTTPFNALLDWQDNSHTLHNDTLCTALLGFPGYMQMSLVSIHCDFHMQVAGIMCVNYSHPWRINNTNDPAYRLVHVREATGQEYVKMTDTRDDFNISYASMYTQRDYFTPLDITANTAVPVEDYHRSGFYHHHHYVPSVVNRSAVMDLHRSRSCATLIQSLYDIFVHSLMLSVHIVLGLPRPLLPFILPSISNRWIL